MADLQGESLYPLQRATVELAYRISCIRRYLLDIEDGAVGEYAPLIDTILSALDRIDKQRFSTLRDVQALRQRQKPGDILPTKITASFLKKYSKWFITIHELLAYLPRPHILPEADITICDAFPDQNRPSIILGSVFNALEFDFKDLVKHHLPDIDDIGLGESSNVVLQIPLCDRSSPSTWPVLAHEMGHAIDNDHGISKGVASSFVTDEESLAFKVVRRWAAEFSADLLAIHHLGPSPILALLNLVYCVYPLNPISTTTETHPSTKWRLQIASDYIKELYGIDFLQKERDSFETSQDFGWKLAETQKSKEEIDASKQLDEQQFQQLLIPIAAEVIDEIKKLPRPDHKLATTNLQRSIDRLRKGYTISAQGEERSLLRDEISTYQARSFETVEEQRDAFRSLVQRFRESPLSIQHIMQSSHERRLEIVSESVEKSVFDEAGIDEAVTSLMKLDDVVVRSINTAAVHNQLDKGKQ